MRVPVNERVKDVPASALRAMFAGLGSLLRVNDKIRSKQAAAEPEVPATGATAAADTVAEPAASAEAEVMASQASDHVPLVVRSVPAALSTEVPTVLRPHSYIRLQTYVTSPYGAAPHGRVRPGGSRREGCDCTGDSGASCPGCGGRELVAADG